MCEIRNQLNHHFNYLLIAKNKAEESHLGVCDDTDHLAIALNCLQVLLDHLLSKVVLPFLGGLGESLLL